MMISSCYISSFLSSLNTIHYLLSSSLCSIILFSFGCWQLLLKSCLICIYDCSSLGLSLCLGCGKCQSTNLIHKSCICLLGRLLSVNLTTVSCTTILTKRALLVLLKLQLVCRNSLNNSWSVSSSLNSKSLSLRSLIWASIITLNNTCLSTIILLNVLVYTR